jgi:hypothetical protein
LLSIASGSAFADSGGPGIEFVVAMTVVYYIFLIGITVPIALVLGFGSVLTRVLIGAAAPTFGLIIAIAVCGLSRWAQSYLTPFFALSTLPTICLAFLPGRVARPRTSGAIRIVFAVIVLVIWVIAIFVDLVVAH